jgi:hypothetical protein
MSDLAEPGALPGHLLRELADSGYTPTPSPSYIAPLFARGFLETDWKLKGGDSTSLSAFSATGSVGSWNLSHKGDSYTLSYVMGGGSAGKALMSHSVGPAWLPSLGTKLYTYGSKPDLEFKDIRGPFVTVGGSIMPAEPILDGYGTIIWFNAPIGAGAFGRILDDIADKVGAKAKLPGILRHFNESAGAVAAIAGPQFSTTDPGSVWITHGMAW